MITIVTIHMISWFRLAIDNTSCIARLMKYLGTCKEVLVGKKIFTIDYQDGLFNKRSLQVYQQGFNLHSCTWRNRHICMHTNYTESYCEINAQDQIAPGENYYLNISYSSVVAELATQLLQWTPHQDHTRTGTLHFA